MIIKCMNCGREVTEIEMQGVFIVGQCTCGSCMWYLVEDRMGVL